LVISITINSNYLYFSHEMDDEDAGYKEKLKQLGFSLLQDDAM
jgi:hypothetical protein